MTKINHLKHGDLLRVTGLACTPDSAVVPVLATVTGQLFFRCGCPSGKHFLRDTLADDGVTLAGIEQVRVGAQQDFEQQEMRKPK